MTFIKKYSEQIGLVVCLIMAGLFVVPCRAYLTETYKVEFSAYHTLLTLLVILIGLGPLGLFVFRRKADRTYVPFLVVWGAATVIEYGYRTLVFNNFVWYGRRFVKSDVLTNSLLTVAGAIVCCYLGYLVIRRSKRGSVLAEKLDFSWSTRIGVPFAFFVGIAGVVAYAAEQVVGFKAIPGALQQPVHLLAGLPVIAIIILFMLQLCGELNRNQVAAFWLVIFLPRLVIGALTGISFQVISLFIPLVFVWLTIKRRIPFVLIAVFIITFAVFQGLRRTSIRETKDILSADKYSGMKMEMFTKAFELDTAYNLAMLDRLGAHNTLGLVMQRVPSDEFPYYKMDAMGTAVFALVPRALWKNKPLPIDLREFGYRTGLMGPNWKDRKNNIRPTQLGMLYATWGVPGVLIGMLLFGGLYGLIEVFTSTGIPQSERERREELSTDYTDLHRLERHDKSEREEPINQQLSTNNEHGEAVDYGKLLLGIVCASQLIDIEGDCFQTLARTIWPALMVILINLGLKYVSFKRLSFR